MDPYGKTYSWEIRANRVRRMFGRSFVSLDAAINDAKAAAELLRDDVAYYISAGEEISGGRLVQFYYRKDPK